MRICILTTLHNADDDLVFYKHTRSLAKRYQDITVVAPVSKRPLGPEADSVQFRWLTASASPLGRVRRLVQAAREVRRLSPDICHFYDLDVIAIVPWLRGNCTLAPVYDALEAWPERMRCARKIPRGMHMLTARGTDVIEKWMARDCFRVITADDATAADFKKRGIRTTTLFNFPPRSLFEPVPPASREIQQRYHGRLIGLYHGSMAEDRGLFQMLQATPLVAARQSSFLLLLIGLADGALKRRATSLIRRLHIEDHVEIVSWVPHTDIVAYLRAARVGLAPLQPIPKYFKNIPQKIFEYMACGVPILGSDLPTITPFVMNAGAGMVTDCTRPEPLADGILRILNDEAAWLRMSRNGRQAFLTEYNWEVMEQRLFTVYEDLESHLHRQGTPVPT
jgi:glycosyltransferase involved in cell wall biosynthesis